MHTYFKPSDISAVPCTIINRTRNGSAFAITEQEEQVYLSPPIVDATSVDIGDHLVAYCVDNHRPEVETQHKARWRAIRVVVSERFVPQPMAAPAVRAPNPAQTPPKELSSSELADRIRALLDQDRAWTAPQLAKAIGQGVEVQRISNWLHYQHENGNVAAARLFANGAQDRASKSFYARDITLLDELIDEIMLS